MSHPESLQPPDPHFESPSSSAAERSGEQPHGTRYREITLEEARALRPEDLPFGSLCRVAREDGTQIFQMIEPADPPGTPLADYRKRELEAINHALESSSIVSVNAPSRSGKSETLLAGYSPNPSIRVFPPASALRGQHNAVFLDGQTLVNSSSLEEQVEDQQEDYDRDPSTIIFDEFRATLPRDRDFLATASSERKLIIAQGGPLSNQEKIRQLQEAAAVANVSENISIVEMSFKPLNLEQIDDLAAIALAGHSSSEEKLAAFHGMLARLRAVANQVPIPLILASDILLGNTNEDLRRAGIDAESTEEQWRAAFKKLASMPEYGRIVSLGDLEHEQAAGS